MILQLALIVLAAVAVGGAGLALIRGLPGWMRLGHGAAAGAGLLLLLIGALGSGGSQTIWLAFGLIAAGFAGGAVLFGVIYKDRKPPGLFIAGHGALNAVGVAVLAWAVLAP